MSGPSYTRGPGGRLVEVGDSEEVVEEVEEEVEEEDFEDE